MITQKYIIQKLVDARSETGGTSLVTLYVPDHMCMDISSELSASKNIKDKAVRKSVKTALESVMRTIKQYSFQNQKLFPENGIILCAGETKQRL